MTDDDNQRYSLLYSAAKRNDINALYNMVCDDKKYTYEYYNRKESNGSTALHKAVENQNVDFVEVLVQKGVHLNVRDRSHRTPYEIAVTLNNPQLLELLRRPHYSEYYINNPPVMNFQSGYVRTPIHLAHPQHPLQNCPASVYSSPYTHIRNFARRTLIYPDNGEKDKEFDKVEGLIANAENYNCADSLIRAYTVESPFYRTLNRTLNQWQSAINADPDVLAYWSKVRDFMNHFDDALRPVNMLCYRGINIKDRRELDVYKPMTDIAFPQFTSTTRDITIARTFTGGILPVIVQINITNPYQQVDVSTLSEYAEEKEILFPPWSAFRVLNVIHNEIDPSTKKLCTRIMLETTEAPYNIQ
ncbi:unnamed protein product [Didymodactylos carnosus]|uniref:ADP ribosyltransferase domain-containing protein n=1 Tax=Didymodactylos carnosus TaxID=1234261 RepID=A0A813RGB0_9BILA|nr:unnamed protein product [Didymodactylos carnosus]CAF3567039.1 unnamed protein product [Didymodactylos carnosus]